MYAFSCVCVCVHSMHACRRVCEREERGRAVDNRDLEILDLTLRPGKFEYSAAALAELGRAGELHLDDLA